MAKPGPKRRSPSRTPGSGDPRSNSSEAERRTGVIERSGAARFIGAEEADAGNRCSDRVAERRMSISGCASPARSSGRGFADETPAAFRVQPQKWGRVYERFFRQLAAQIAGPADAP
jgi:hypothetical protein